MSNSGYLPPVRQWWIGRSAGDAKQMRLRRLNFNIEQRTARSTYFALPEATIASGRSQNRSGPFSKIKRDLFLKRLFELQFTKTVLNRERSRYG